jgi:heme/copper-type cytochrome/quinol oxidase subunit 2
MRWLIALALLAVTLLLVPLPKMGKATTRYITLNAAQFEFTPDRVHFNQGDRVIIMLTASDVVHGFYLDGYGLETRVEPGVSQKIEFVADKAGKFRYRCAVNCGSLHPFMIGELVVDSNTPFWRAVSLVVLAAVGMLVYVWQSSRLQEMKQDGTHEATP